MSSREDVLRRVQGLLNKAASTEFDEERDSLLAKADEMMFKYAIDSYELDKQRKSSNRQESIVKRSIAMVKNDSPLSSVLIDLMSAVARHNRCRVVYSWVAHGYTIHAIVVGFEGDTEYVEMLYTSLWMQMLQHLEPKPSPDLSYEENVVMLLENGQSRKRACELMGIPFTHAEGLKMSRVYRTYCEKNGAGYAPKARPRGSTYQFNFARGFVTRVQNRFWEIQNARGENKDVGTALVLRDRSKEVNDALKDMFPRLSSLRRKAEGKFNEGARARGDAAGRVADLGQPKVKRGDSKALPK